MARERRRIVYNEDATLIEETPSKNTEAETTGKRRSATRNVEIPVSSVFDAFASYTQFLIDKGDGKGKCAICNSETQYDVRKICVKCMKQYSEQLHEKTVNALEIGDRAINVDMVE